MATLIASVVTVDINYQLFRGFSTAVPQLDRLLVYLQESKELVLFWR